LTVDVIITSDPEKLPPEIRALQDEAQPMPPGARFFEQRFSFLMLVRNGAIALVLALLGLAAFVLFAIMVVESFGPTTVANSSFDSRIELSVLAVSAVLWFACYLMLGSLLPAARLAWSGKRSRYGIVLMGDRLVSHSLFDTTIVPRDKFTSITGGKVGYQLGGDAKSFTLPDIIDDRRHELEAAIRSWKAGSA
jgi:hypothetical protein